MKNRLGAAALAAAVCIAMMAHGVEPDVWYRADMGVTTNAQGKVTAWANQGTIGSAADLACTNTAAPGAWFFASAPTMGGAPALELDGHDILVSAGNVSFGTLSDGGAWFVAFRSYDSGSSALNYGPFGHGTSSSLFAFFHNSSDKLMAYFYGNGNNIPSNWAIDRDACVMSCGTYKYQSGSNDFGIQAWHRGEPHSSFFGWTARVGEGRFVVGVFNPEFNWTKPFRGLVAEVRVYATGLTAAERFKVECEMAARYA